MANSFSPDDVRLLEKTISVRERIIDNLLTKELPTKARDIDTLTNLLESVDRSIFSKAKIKIDERDSKSNEETKEVLKQLMLNLHSNNKRAQPEAPVNAPTFQPQQLSINEGELIARTDNQDIEQFVK